MSDDRYNDPNRHPMHNPQQSGYGEEDDQTQMVDMSQFGDQPNFAPPPMMDPGEATQLFEIPPSMSGGGDDSMMSSAPDFGSSFGSESYQNDSFSSAPNYNQQGGFGPPPGGAPNYNQQGGFGPPPGGTPNYNQQGGFGPPPGGGGVGAGAGFGSGPQQVYVGGDDPGYEGHTQFVNIADFAQQAAHFTPEQQQAGYDGNTQFVDINALMSGGPQGGGVDPIDSDKVLKQGYQYTKNHIKRGDVTTIDASNPLGKQVVLKRVWEGNPQEMSTPLRQRVNQLHELRHPNLVKMNGMFVSESGMWVEVDTPKGIKLSSVLQNRGPQAELLAFQWVETIASVLSTVHQNQLAYANLTPDSIWIDLDTNALQIEPFDMLRLADRGNLGEFGGPEMNVPPDQRQLSPATDVFSLAAIYLVLLKGLPFDLAKIETIESKALAATLRKALAPEQKDRFQSIEEFITSIKKGGGLDIKVVGGVGVALVVLLVIAMTVLGGGSGTAPEPERAIVAAPGEHAASPNDEDGDEARAEAQEPRPNVELPGPVTRDARLTIESSYLTNPPDLGTRNAPSATLDQWRREARDAIEKGDAARSDNEKWGHYDTALQALTRVLRNQDEPLESDWESYNNLLEKPVVAKEMKQLREEFDALIRETRFRPLATRYRGIYRRDPRANAGSFFENTASASIIEISVANSKNDEEGGEE